MTTPDPAAAELTALQLCEAHQAQMAGALTAAVGMLQDLRRRRPQGLSVNDQAVLDGLTTASVMLPALVDYAVQVQTSRDALSARVAASTADTTAASLLALLTGLVALCTPPITAPAVPSPSQPLVGSLADAWQAGHTAGYARHAADVLARVSARLA